MDGEFVNQYACVCTTYIFAQTTCNNIPLLSPLQLSVLAIIGRVQR